MIDTRDKRASAIGWRLPLADGAIDALDRLQCGGWYRLELEEATGEGFVAYALQIVPRVSGLASVAARVNGMTGVRHRVKGTAIINRG